MNCPFVQETPPSLEVLQVRKTPGTDDQIHGPIMIPIDGQKPSDFGILRWQRGDPIRQWDITCWSQNVANAAHMEKIIKHHQPILGIWFLPYASYSCFSQKFQQIHLISTEMTQLDAIEVLFSWDELQPGHCPNSSRRKGCQAPPAKPTHPSVARSTRCGHHGAHSTFRSNYQTGW